MLQALSIRDFVIVQALDLEFASGFTTLTGETGAGKSILIDALSLALGARNEGAVVRAGAERADISITFSNNPQANIWLDENALEAGSELVLRRVIYTDGRSRGFINGVAATIGQLKELGEMLVDIYSQNAHHSLLSVHTQRQILDNFAGANALAKQVAAHYKTWANLHKQRLEIDKNAAAYADELAELRDKTRELAALNFSAEMWAELQAEQAKLSNGAALLQGLEATIALLGDAEINAEDTLSQAQSQLERVAEFDAALKEPLDSIASALIQVQEASRSLNRYLRTAELDPARLQEVDEQMRNIHDTARKYRLRIEEIADELLKNQARMAELEGFATDGALAKQEAVALASYQAAAQQLSALRTKAAKTLGEKISAEMQKLSLSGGKFLVALQACEPTANGLENVEFLVAGHAGVAPRALNKVASGGELSRISLALHVTTALNSPSFNAPADAQNTQAGGVACMIFDEVDVGIGGGVAEVVGKLLKQLGENRQVLVITHLPQVAAQAAQHWQVHKTQANGTTLSHIQVLDTQKRIEEIARMLGGIQITDTTRNHAKEMLGYS